jgi:hypothetical protein
MKERSTELGELVAALSAAQGEFQSVGKSATNPFFKSSYAPLPEVVKAASPILTKHGLAVAQFLGHDERGDTLTTWLMHKSGQFISDTMQLRPVKDDPQAQGSATTYGRRYAYMAALGLVADDDDDGNAGSRGQNGQARKPQPLSAENRAKVLKAFEDAGITKGIELYYSAAGLDRPENMTAAHAVKLRELLDKELSEREKATA